MLTTIVACYAAAVATGSLIVAVLAFRAAGPRLRIVAYTVTGKDMSGKRERELVIEVINNGRGEITIDEVYARVRLRSIADIFPPAAKLHLRERKKVELALSGPALP
jgi:hypothetical protein